MERISRTRIHFGATIEIERAALAAMVTTTAAKFKAVHAALGGEPSGGVVA